MLVTCFQLFAIGLGFGLAGPCLVTCAPVLLAYSAGSDRTWKQALVSACCFLSGRFIAYCALGMLAGVSASLVRRVAGQGMAAYFTIAAGVVSVALGLVVAWPPHRRKVACGSERCGPRRRASLVALGLCLGIAPCGPLLALLLEIALMSKSALQGLSYAGSFGVGTFVSGLMTVGVASGIGAHAAGRYLRSVQAQAIFRTMCALVLAALGIALIVQGAGKGI